MRIVAGISYQESSQGSVTRIPRGTPPRIGGRSQAPDFLDGVLGHIRPLNTLALIMVPVSAIFVYTGFRTMSVVVPTNVVLYVITVPLGFWFWFRRLWLTFRPRCARFCQPCRTQPRTVRMEELEHQMTTPSRGNLGIDFQDGSGSCLGESRLGVRRQ
jgi:hypothetical protein